MELATHGCDGIVNAPIAMEVIEAALPFVDVLAFQDFRDPVTHLHDWHQKTGKPVLLADAARMKWMTKPGEYKYSTKVALKVEFLDISRRIS